MKHAEPATDTGAVGGLEEQRALKAYFAEAQTWDRDWLTEARRSARRAWQVALGAAVCALAASVASLALMPLKGVEPYLIRVDSSTGVVDVVPVYRGALSLPQSVTRYFLAHYVSVCERFDYAIAESDYQECGAFHSARRNQVWSALWSPTNPASPLNLHRDGSTVSVEIESVSFFQRANGIADLAQVRYRRIERAGEGGADRLTHWIATIQYAYAGPSTDPAVRRWNPLGFKIVDFVAEPEVGREAVEPAPGATGRGER